MKNNTSGAAVFLPFHVNPWDDPWDIRLKIIHAIQKDEAPVPYIIKQRVELLPKALSISLYGDDEQMNLIEKYHVAMTGKTKGSYHCVAFWSGEEGLMFHLEGEELLCSFLPVVTKKNIKAEIALIEQIRSLALSAQGIQLNLKRPIQRGRYQLKDLLSFLAENMCAK